MNHELVDLYRAMKRIRMTEAAVAEHYYDEVREMHTPIHLYDGQEAIAVGVCSNLEKEDVVFSNHRCHGHYLAKGGSLEKLVAELHNRETGCCRGRGGSMHLMDWEAGVALTSAIVAGNVSIATGYALAEQMKGSGQIAVAFFGDGASEEGSVYESICFAALKKLPIVFVCENNLYAIATPLDRREPTPDISSKFATILLAQKIDGNDVLSVYRAAEKAVNAARKGEGPSFLECMTYRLRDHHNIGNGVDGRFRTEEEVKDWMRSCPIERVRQTLLSKGNVSMTQLDAIDAEISQEIEEAFAYARGSACPGETGLFDGLWG